MAKRPPAPTRESPSALYLQCLNEATWHHSVSKTYSGKFLRPHAPFIREIITRLHCRSILDYGCGKGNQYAWVSHGDDASIPKGMTLEQYWMCPVYKFDPAYPPLATPPPDHEQFDLVLCTHALGSIPISDLPWVVDELICRARKAVYIAEKIGPVGKRVFSEPEKMPRWSGAQWAEFIRSRPHPWIEIMLATREKTPEGVITTRETL